MGLLGWVAGTPTWTMSYEVDASNGATVTYDVYWWGGPGVAEASLTNFNNSTGAHAWVMMANGSFYDKPAVYKKDLKQVTFVVLSQYSAGETPWWVGARFNIVYFAAGASVLET